MYYEVIDNFLSKEEHTLIKETLMGTGSDFPWYFYDLIVYENSDDEIERLHNFQFNHIFYNTDFGRSNQYYLVDRLVNKLNAFPVLRVKANMNPYSPKKVLHGMHVDYGNFYGKTAVYYVNTNNGQTIFDDGTSIDSVENRILIFDADRLHTGTTCTDQKVRCVINVDYFEKNKIYKSQ